MSVVVPNSTVLYSNATNKILFTGMKIVNKLRKCEAQIAALQIHLANSTTPKDLVKVLLFQLPKESNKSVFDRKLQSLTTVFHEQILQLRMSTLYELTAILLARISVYFKEENLIALIVRELPSLMTQPQIVSKLLMEILARRSATTVTQLPANNSSPKKKKRPRYSSPTLPPVVAPPPPAAIQPLAVPRTTKARIKPAHLPQAAPKQTSFPHRLTTRADNYSAPRTARSRESLNLSSLSQQVQELQKLVLGFVSSTANQPIPPAPRPHPPEYPYYPQQPYYYYPSNDGRPAFQNNWQQQSPCAPTA
jgi:hypothetical protein